MTDLKGKVAIVTGSSAGVGAEVAQQLAARGINVVVNYSASKAEGEAVLAACQQKSDAILVQANVANDDDCRKLAQAAIDQWGRIDYLVNNAGISKFAGHHDLEALSADDFMNIYKVNVIGSYQMIRACAPAMQEHGNGAVVNVSSIAGVAGVGSSVAYAASKGALNTMTISLARALGPAIRVNAVCPGMIDTRWLRNGLGQELFTALYDDMAGKVPLRDVCQPKDVAQPILYFLLEARMTTGETMLVDGGYHLDFAAKS